MNDIVKIAAVGIIAAVCAMVIRKQAPELSVLLTICTVAVILIGCIGAMSAIRSYMDELSGIGGLTPTVVGPVIKVTGIAIISRFAADFCRDAKESAMASAVETAGSVIALIAVLPLMDCMLDLIGEMV